MEIEEPTATGMSAAAPRKKVNLWGLAGLVLAVASLAWTWVRMCTLVWPRILGESFTQIAVTRRLLGVAPFFGAGFAVVGLILKKGKEWISCVACLLVVGLALGTRELLKHSHRCRVERVRRIASAVSQYAKERGEYPERMSELTALGPSDRAIVHLIPGVSLGDEVRIPYRFSGITLFGADLQGPRMVFYVRKVTFGERLFYSAEGELHAESDAQRFTDHLDASTKARR